ncbi:MAG: NAD(P)-binding domain-containing protein [Terracidiphilus sp.]
MKVGVLGSGDVAKALASGFLKHDHQVMIGSGSPAKLADWAAKNPAGSTGTFAAVAAFGDLLVLAVKASAAASVLRLAGEQNIAGKTVVDANNPIADAPPDHGVLRFFTTYNESLMEQLQREFPDVNFVKAFNSVGAPFMIDPQFPDGKPTMFICGNNEDAKKTVGKILDQFGWETADMGSVESARAIEPLCMLWCLPGLLRNEWTHAFKLLRM